MTSQLRLYSEQQRAFGIATSAIEVHQQIFQTTYMYCLFAEIITVQITKSIQYSASSSHKKQNIAYLCSIMSKVYHTSKIDASYIHSVSVIQFSRHAVHKLQNSWLESCPQI